MTALQRTVFRITKFVSNRKEVFVDAPSSKRGILKVPCSLFDPLSRLVAFILIAKFFLLELWRLDFDWDTELSPDIIPHWERWKKNVENVSCVRVPRCFYSAGTSVTTIQLHVFVDASELTIWASGISKIFIQGRYPLSW